ncbi:hypothetical protein [Arcticibacter sp. MXS-1]|uniref:hypothetical protein n=1 Tax=Arcticibacter sp. MXS-1 TaxID=3341726 RepID=UPI0035A97024
MKRIAVVLFSIILLGMPHAHARGSVLYSVEISCDKKQIKTSGNEVVSILVKIKNNGANTMRGLLQTRSSEPAIAVLGRAVASVDLNGRDSIFLPVKIFIPVRVTAGREYTLTFDLTEEEGALPLFSQKCKIVIEEKKHLYNNPSI